MSSSSSSLILCHIAKKQKMNVGGINQRNTTSCSCSHRWFCYNGCSPVMLEDSDYVTNLQTHVYCKDRPRVEWIDCLSGQIMRSVSGCTVQHHKHGCRAVYPRKCLSHAQESALLSLLNHYQNSMLGTTPSVAPGCASPTRRVPTCQYYDGVTCCSRM